MLGHDAAGIGTYANTGSFLEIAKYPIKMLKLLILQRHSLDFRPLQCIQRTIKTICAIYTDCYGV